MKTYQYQVLRYLHDRVTGEFVNVGIIFFEPQSPFLRAKVLHKYQRISQFFLGVNGRPLLAVLRHIETTVNRKGLAIAEQRLFESVDELEQLTAALIRPNDAAWQLSSVESGLTMDPQSTFDKLYHRIVEQYTDTPVPSSTSDEEVWRNKYKQYFDRYQLTSHLHPKQISTANDEISFQQTWQNGSLHCYEAVSFDLRQASSIRDKAYKWFGRLSELHTSSEMLHIYLLTAAPDEPELREFVDQKLKSAQTRNVQIDIIHEEEAESFARDVKQKMERSASH